MRINRNSTNAFSEICLKVKNIRTKYQQASAENTAPFLHEHQFITSTFVSEMELGTHGMLIMHGLGTGKTILAAACVLRMQNRFRGVAFMAPKSLHENFRQAVNLAASKLNVDLHIPIIYISFGSPRMEDLTSSYLSNMLLVIDEAHNFVRGVINGTKRASAVYKAILSATGNYTLFFTGTPITKHPFDVVPFINAITKSATLPEDINNFEDMFMKFSNDGDPNGVKKTRQFCDRLLGLVSVKETDTADPSIYPTVRPLMVMEVEMEETQAAVYARVKEREDVSAKRTKFGLSGRPSSLAGRVGSKKSPPSSCYAKSRMASNVVKTAGSFGKMFSGKIEPVAKFLVERSTRPCIVYSQFLEYGLFPLLAALKELGESACEIMSGKASAEERADVERRFNSAENRHGAVIRFLLLSAVGAEGLNLHRVQYAIALEPYWLNTRLIQFFGRGVRPLSHADLPEEDRWVQPVVFVSVSPDAHVESIEKTMFVRGTRMMKIIHHFERLLMAVSLECCLHQDAQSATTKCHACVPDGKPLFTNDIVGDLTRESPCTIATDQPQPRVGRELIYRGMRYVAEEGKSEGAHRFFKHNKAVDVFEPVSEGSIVYNALVSLSKNKLYIALLDLIASCKKDTVIMFVPATASDRAVQSAQQQFPSHCMYPTDTAEKMNIVRLMVGISTDVVVYSVRDNKFVILGQK